MALRLWKAGLGTPDQILAMPSDTVLDAWEYLKFLEEFEETAMEMNKP